jgi:hypothetical protein
MSDEVPDRVDAAVRAYIGAVAFCCVLIGAELMEKGNVGVGGFLVLVGLPLYLSAAIWRLVKTKLDRRVLTSVNSIASDARWWVGVLLVVLTGLAISPFLGDGSFLTYALVTGAALLAAATAIAPLLPSWRKDDLSAPPPVVSAGEQVFSPTLTLLPYSSDKIYIGEIVADNPLGQLTKNRYIEFTVRIFNGNAVELSLASVRGVVGCRQVGDQPHHIQPLDLSDTPVLKPSDTNSLPPFRETTLAIWQHVPANVADNILKALNQSRGVQFSFDKLNIQLSNQSNPSTRLPLWDAVEVGRNFRTRRVAAKNSP